MTLPCLEVKENAMYSSQNLSEGRIPKWDDQTFSAPIQLRSLVMSDLPPELWLHIVEHLPLHDLCSLYHAYATQVPSSDIPSICTLQATKSVIPSLLTKGTKTIEVAIQSTEITKGPFERYIPNEYITRSLSLHRENNKRVIELSSDNLPRYPHFSPGTHGGEPILIGLFPGICKQRPKNVVDVPLLRVA